MENNQLEYVGFWARVGAVLIDTVLLMAIEFPLLLAFYGSAYFTADNSIQGPVDFMLDFVFPTVATILFWFWKQATPGKMALSAKIVDAETGKEPSIAQYIGRYFAYIISAIPFCLGFIWVAFDSKKQGWHDKLAGTVVVRSKIRTEEVKFRE